MAAAGITTRVSVASDGMLGSSSSSNPSISANGRYVAVPSSASNQVGGDVKGAQMPQTSVPSLIQDTADQNPCTAVSNLGKHLPIGANSLYPIIDAMSIASTPRIMDFYHSGVDSSVHIVDQISSPYTGNQRYYFPAMTANLIITADGVMLNYTMGSDFANGAFLFADVNVPTGTTLLKLDYDQLDSAIAFEGLWYLSYGWNWGPMTMIVHLPSDASIVRYEGASFATLLDSHTLKFVIPDGTAFYDTVVYSTTSVPNLYDTITSPHFQVFLPSVYRQYSDRIVSLLENAYILFSQYSGQDVNQLANQTHYDYYFPPGGWYWWGSTIPADLSQTSILRLVMVIISSWR
jgi:hypothetical protein